MSRTVLIVDDADTCATTLEIAFQSIPGLTLEFAASAEAALHLLVRQPPLCALITDLHIGPADGFDLIRRARALDGTLPIIVISGDTDPRTPKRVAQLGANAFFSKPYSPAMVRRKLEELLHGQPQ